MGEGDIVKDCGMEAEISEVRKREREQMRERARKHIRE